MCVPEIAYGIGSTCDTRDTAENYDNFRTKVSSPPFERTEYAVNKRLPSARSRVYSAGCITRIEALFPET